VLRTRPGQNGQLRFATIMSHLWPDQSRAYAETTSSCHSSSWFLILLRYPRLCRAPDLDIVDSKGSRRTQVHGACCEVRSTLPTSYHCRAKFHGLSRSSNPITRSLSTLLYLINSMLLTALALRTAAQSALCIFLDILVDWLVLWIFRIPSSFNVSFTLDGTTEKSRLNYGPRKDASCQS
jgi:hypothetical protein